MDYMNLQNIMADTDMRDSIGKATSDRDKKGSTQSKITDWRYVQWKY